MENASKALIIAGAILLSIVIISLGLIVVNNTKDTITGANMDETEIAAFNAKFENYEGSNVSGSQVNALIQQVITSDVTNYREGSGNYVKITFPSVSDKTGKTSMEISVDDNSGVQYKYGNAAYTNTTSGKSPKVATGKNYSVVLNYDATTALINEITVTTN